VELILYLFSDIETMCQTHCKLQYQYTEEKLKQCDFKKSEGLDLKW